jgi:carbamoyltransferase
MSAGDLRLTVPPHGCHQAVTQSCPFVPAVLINTSSISKASRSSRRRAMRSRFLNTGIDYLALHNLLITKNALHKVLAPIVQVYADVSMIVREGMRAG